MSKITLVTGGSRSGKSSFSEKLLKHTDDVLYIATAIVTDKEMEDRIERHRKGRNHKWETLESYEDLHEKISNYTEKYILLDCVTVMTTNIMFSKYTDYENLSQEKIDEVCEYIKLQFRKLIDKVKDEDKEIIMVTNEVGWGLVPEYKLSRIFRDIAGFVNQHIAELSDEVYLVSCGLPLKLKG
ncbi:bifunctional adenosylcobinamide kinase/adenosylcobinamide-phosphate guanylyltransferase [Clostridium frigidicarnis]|uniref:Adenosylcobinamide kinase n=1 Tax=Clostridium frigidicarnis TaxID=84698 RepID=A0A1I0XYX3_9CLOT|nr:bifunctional adenosylcobinamide kinase/adenosylcobinamide-phosphate guanylyltransferase [Clostridium frigidicarnis]SFB06261.1 adenosylcobinamide kinase /adenosylcobinamide-phosphate guanylyltransferase [Clostridium frigidicarnis]